MIVTQVMAQALHMCRTQLIACSQLNSDTGTVWDTPLQRMSMSYTVMCNN